MRRLANLGGTDENQNRLLCSPLNILCCKGGENKNVINCIFNKIFNRLVEGKNSCRLSHMTSKRWPLTRWHLSTGSTLVTNLETTLQQMALLLLVTVDTVNRSISEVWPTGRLNNQIQITVLKPHNHWKWLHWCVSKQDSPTSMRLWANRSY